MQALLTQKGFEVLMAGNGREGLRCFKANPTIGLIISDVNMPELDGISMCEEIKSIPGVKMPPVLMLTAETNQEMKAKAKAVGVRAWISKPFNETSLMKEVNRILKA